MKKKQFITFILSIFFVGVFAQSNDYFLLNQKVPYFNLSTPTGIKVSPENFKGKYVLIDFWASWCGPCRAENPNVKNMYAQYKNKNFTVLGVSLDRDMIKWKNAIAKDKLEWTNVSDLKEWNSIVVNMFQFDGIPFNVLVDPTGKIIASGLRGGKLEATLKNILK